MPRLHFKRTAEEEEERAYKKARKAAKREKRAQKESQRQRYYYMYNETSAGDPGPSSPRPEQRKSNPVFGENSDEEARFNDKLRDALDDDGVYDPTERLHHVEERLNSYAHIPRRWRGTDEGFSAGLWMEDAREEIGLEPWQMNDDEYAEYMRAGMWRKKHQAEFQEKLRRKEEREARKERERQVREESRRLEREAQAERERLSAARSARRLAEARRNFDERWTKLLEKPSTVDDGSDLQMLCFDDIPWPIYPPSRKHAELSFDDFSIDALSEFLFPNEASKNSKGDGNIPKSNSRKDVLRATMLKFHPDKFESRVLSRVREEDKARVKEAGGIVMRILNDLSVT